LRENCPFESFGRVPGKQRQAISVSSLLVSFFEPPIDFPISYYCLMRLFSCCGFLSFLLRSGLFLFLSPRLLPLLVWYEAAPRCPSYTRMKPSVC